MIPYLSEVDDDALPEDKLVIKEGKIIPQSLGDFKIWTCLLGAWRDDR